MPNIEKTPKTVEIIHVVQGQCPSSWRSRRSLSYHRYCSWIRLCGDARCGEIQVRATQTRKNTWKLPQIPYTNKILGVPVAMQHQDPTVAVSTTTDACDSDVQQDDPWSSHKPSTLKGTRTSRL